ncbi:MAG: hypothetical protein ACLSDQ_06880 [Adlercreutzia equolifaciens]
MIRVKNFVPAISAEGDEAATDGRRGAGTYAKVDAAMDLLASHGLPFGVSICYTHDNAHSVASDAYFDWLIDKGRSSPGSSPTCPWARARRPSSCPRRTTANCSTISTAACGRRSPS